jgi:hypothetical protein
MVPLTEDMVAILDRLPRLNQGTYLFSFTNGAKPIWISSKEKERLDAHIGELCALWPGAVVRN